MRLLAFRNSSDRAEVFEQLIQLVISHERSLFVGVEVEGEEIPVDPSQHHGLDALEVVEAIASRFVEGQVQWCLRVVREQATQVSQAGDGATARSTTMELRYPCGEIGQQGMELSLLEQELLVATLLALGAFRSGRRMRVVPSTRRG
jgi:hypothetical protein